MEQQTGTQSTTESLVNAIENGGKLGGASGALLYLAGGALAHKMGVSLDLLSTTAYGAALGGALGGGREMLGRAANALAQHLSEPADKLPPRIEPTLDPPFRASALPAPTVRQEWRPLAPVHEEVYAMPEAAPHRNGR